MKLVNVFMKKRMRSFRYAFQGIFRFFQEEHNALLHLMATATVVVLAIFFHVQGGELLALIIVTGIVWMAELFNTSIERLADLVSKEYHPGIGYLKDLAAAAVLIASVTAVITGTVIFLPKLLI